jgi:N-methylhydantoinase B/oxoprolinase/acetone carboxylase alpha subunit
LLRIRDGQETPIAPKSDAVRLLKGDIVRLETSGGGGFGDPIRRSAEQHKADRALGYVTG